MATAPIIRTLAAAPDTGATMPALFIGRGNPMNATEDTEFSRAWADAARSLPKPIAGGRSELRQTPPALWGPQGRDRSQEEGVVSSSPASTKRLNQTRAHGGIIMNHTIEIIIGTTG